MLILLLTLFVLKQTNVLSSSSKLNMMTSYKNELLYENDGKMELQLNDDSDSDVSHPDASATGVSKLPSKIGDRKNHQCPDDLIEIVWNRRYVCLKVSKFPQTFDEHACYGSDYLITRRDLNSELKWQLMKMNITQFWMPVRRLEEKRFKPFVIRLPGRHWNQLYNFNEAFIISGNESKKHCLAAHLHEEISLSEFKITDCNQELYSVCVFREHFVAIFGCPEQYGALSHLPNQCYGINVIENHNCRIVSLDEYNRKNNSIWIIFNAHRIKIENLISLGQSINGSLWVLDKKKRINFISTQKQMPALSFIQLTNNKSNALEMTLNINTYTKDLILTVYNRLYIWSNENRYKLAIHCFTNAGDYDEIANVYIDKIWENDQKTKTMFKLKIRSDNPGLYWCEAHTIFNFTLVSTEKIEATKHRRGYNYALMVDIRCDVENARSMCQSRRKLANEIKRNLKAVRAKDKALKVLRIHKVRVMQIDSVSSDLGDLRALCHTTVSIKSDSNALRNDKNDLNTKETDTRLRIMARDLLIALMKIWQPHLTSSVCSTEFCFPDDQWKMARRGQFATTFKFCLQNNGLPLTRKCLGNSIQGAYWDKLSDIKSICITDIAPKYITKNLYMIDKMKDFNNQPDIIIKNIRKLLELNLENLIPADVHYLANIVRSITANFMMASSNSTLATKHQFQNISETFIDVMHIYNNLLEVDDHTLQTTLVLNSTNILLDIFENLIEQMWVEFEDFERSSISEILQTVEENRNDSTVTIIDYEDIGVVANIASNLLIFIIDPDVANVTGVALFQADPDDVNATNENAMLQGAFENEYYRFILGNQSANELLNELNILMGTYVPELIWQRLDEISIHLNQTIDQRPQPKVVIKIYANDKFFQENKTIVNQMVSGEGKVISISIPGHDTDLPDIVPLVLKINGDGEINNNTVSGNDGQMANAVETEQACSYWNYEKWVNDGLLFLKLSDANDTILCGCTHLTPFAYLVGTRDNLPINSEEDIIVAKIHQEALDVITLFGCSLSLFGILGIFLTACVFRTWRKKINSKVLLQLSVAIALQMVLFCFVNTERNTQHLISNKMFSSCIAIGALLHYSVLVQFCWMIIIAYLQFKRYVQIFGNTRPKRFLVKSTLIGWCLPLVPVILCLSLDSESYIPIETSNPICYPTGLSLYLGIVLPVILVILTNLSIYLFVIYNILNSPAGSIRQSEKGLILSQIRLLILLFFLLGFTWVFGLMSAMKIGLIFSYLFSLTATLQGFVLFVYFIIMDPVTRRMWYGYLCRLCGLKISLDNSSNFRETTQSP
uniref:G-protein coupled receptors family 2 profile 2 domain-containing protein n=1 Tax=Glossina palpalis gambiensis TaxID=67801 RepID=A0A1B0C2W9_9MUSC